MEQPNTQNYSFSRTLEDTVLKIAQTFPVVLITGPRQVGKTTLFRQCMEKENRNRTYISLDDVKARNLAKSDPELFLQTFRAPVLIDEVQYAPELFPYIKLIADREQTCGLFWLTGSQQFSLMHQVTESLAGRAGILQLQGLSRREIAGDAQPHPFIPGQMALSADTSRNAAELYAHILRGSYPALYARPETDTYTFYSSYVQTYIERDVQSVVRVGDQRAFVSCMSLLAARTGQLLNYSDVSRDCGVSVNTVKSWVSVLESSGIICLLPGWSSNLSLRTVKMPKLYFMDTGLCCYLTGWQSVQPLMEGIMNGSILETYVVSEISKSWIHTGKSAPLFFYRDRDGHEIDLLISYDGTLYPAEIKRSANPDISMTKSFSVLEKAGVKTANGSILCLYPSYLPLNRTTASIPVWDI
jgi:uncharacterized protein